MITRLPFVFGAAVALAVMSMLFISMARPARPPLVKAQTGAPFHERWQEPLAQPLVPKMIRVIPITPRVKPQPVAQAPVVKEAPPPAKSKPKREREANDICRGRGKTYRNGGRSWRCKRK